MKCPKCGSEDVFVQNVQTGSTSTGKIVMREPRKMGCLYWLCFGWVIDFIYYFGCMGWLWKLLFGTLRGDKVGVGKTQGKEKSILETRATCQNCGHTWKV